MLRRIANKILESTRLVKHLRQELKKYKVSHPPWHFYSPIVDVDEISGKRDIIFAKAFNFDFIKTNPNQDKLFIDLMTKYHDSFKFPEFSNGDFRFYYNNEYFTSPDGLMLYSMICESKPKRIIEIGFGFSSALMLDTNEMMLNNSIKLIFIEPYPDRLNSLLRNNDEKLVEIYNSNIQDVELHIFKNLAEGDILFIDSSHVCKTGSDLNHIIFEILPKLKKGVVIHFHDIFFPFEYPQEWILNTNKSPYFIGFGWNEAYLLRAFLSLTLTLKSLYSTTIYRANTGKSMNIGSLYFSKPMEEVYG